MSLSGDFRKGEKLAEGIELLGGDITYEEGEDGIQSLLLPEGGYLKLQLPSQPW